MYIALRRGVVWSIFKDVRNILTLEDCWDAATGLCEPIAGKHHKNQVSKLAIEGTNLYSISMDDTFRLTSTETNEYR